MSLIDIYLARQPIFDNRMKIYGYEVLFRNGDQQLDSPPGFIPEAATSNVLINTFSEFGLKRIIGEGKRVFVNYNDKLLLNTRDPFFSPRNVVIEVLESVSPTPSVIAKLKSIRQKGYLIALDDYIFDPQYQPLEAVADLIKVDILNINLHEHTEHIARLQQQGIKLLAEKIETPEQFHQCQQLGFEYFQGYFFAKPDLLSAKSLPVNSLQAMQILAKAHEEHINITTLGELIKQDVSLSQKLINTISTIEPDEEISSIQHAIFKFGLNRLQNWITMMVLSDVQNKPNELYKTALLRARFCELIGEDLGQYGKDMYFTTGLFSILDAAFDQPMDKVLAEMGLCKDIKQALIYQQGLLGEALSYVKQIEQGGKSLQSNHNLSPLSIMQKYILAIEYANRITAN